MSLPIDYPFVEVGDENAALEAWRIDGIRDTNTNRGVLYVKVVNPGGGNATVELYTDKGRAASDLVAQGTGAVDTRITLTEANNSGLSGSVIAKSGEATSAIDLHVRLATMRDLQEREDRLAELLLEDPPEVTLDSILKATMRQFLIRMQRMFPPAALITDPLRTYESPMQSSPFGSPERFADTLWQRNDEDDFELVGLQNPTDYKEWAIVDSLARVWARRADIDPTVLELKRSLQIEADREWEMVQPWIDIGENRSADRIVRTKNLRFGRG